MFEVIDEGDGVVIGACGPVLLVALRGQFTLDSMERITSATHLMEAKFTEFGTIVVVDSSTRGADADALQLARAEGRRGRDRQLCVCLIVYGSPAFQMFAKALAAGSQLAVRPTSPWKVFSADDIAEAVQWATSIVEARGLPCDAQAIVDAVPELVARRIAVDDARSQIATTSENKNGAPSAERNVEIHEQKTAITPSPVASAGTEASATVRTPRFAPVDASAIERELGAIGNLRLLERIGSGGMAEAFRAVRSGPGGFQKQLVVKVMLPHLAARPEYRAMFLNEARLAARLPSHANIVQVFEAGEDGGRAFIAMELVDGLTAQQLAKRAWAAGRAVPVDVVAAIGADAARGLHHAHTNPPEHGGALVHRDVTPDNLMVARDGTTKLLDFGIARAVGDRGEHTSTDQIKGKLPFMSPEQIGGRALDGRADLYALGVTLYWMLARTRPFAGETDADLIRRILLEPAPALASVAPTVPGALADVIDKLLDKEPRARVASGQELAIALDEAVSTRRDAVSAFVDEMQTTRSKHDAAR